MSANSVIKSTAEDMGNSGAAFYFDPKTVATGKEAGLDAFRLYLLGRGGVMGDVTGQVMQSAFGYFNPATIVPVWDSGVEIMSATKTAEMYWESAAQLGREKLGDAAGLTEFCAAAQKVIAAADRDGFPLFAGIAEMPLAQDTPAKAYQLAVVLRELRGGAHLCAIRSVGLSAKEAHAVKRPDMAEVFGWGGLVIADEDGVNAKLTEAETLTDTALESAYSVLSADEEAAYVAGSEAIAAALA